MGFSVGGPEIQLPSVTATTEQNVMKKVQKLQKFHRSPEMVKRAMSLTDYKKYR